MAGACLAGVRRLFVVGALIPKGSPQVHVARVVICEQYRTPQILASRLAGFFNRYPADNLWEGVSSVSNAGKNRGRGKRGGSKRKIDLNRGQRIGDGKSPMVWPGLNAPVTKESSFLNIRKLPKDPLREEKLLAKREKGGSFRRVKLPALQRGWTGTKLPGTSVGPPDSIGSFGITELVEKKFFDVSMGRAKSLSKDIVGHLHSFDGFDTKVLELKMVANMTGNLGRKQRFSAFVVTGNTNGLAGYALAKANTMQTAVKKAKNKAAQRLQFVERFQDHTIFHNFYSKEMKTAVLAKKQPQGYGLVCHRALKTICQVIGIQDMYAKVEGSTKNVQNITKAFFNGLQKQETHEELAERLQLNVVEYRQEKKFFPKVLASPKEGAKEKGVDKNSVNFENLYFDGKVPLYRPKKLPSWMKDRRWLRKKGQLNRLRNQPAAQFERLALGFEPTKTEFLFRHRPLTRSQD